MAKEVNDFQAESSNQPGSSGSTGASLCAPGRFMVNMAGRGGG